MATTNSESAPAYGQLRLAAQDPEVEHSASGSNGFTVKFALEGTNLLELQDVLTPRLAGVGVERISRSGMTITLYGVEEGRESEVFHEVQSGIDDVNRARRAAADDAEDRRSATAAAGAISDARLKTVRESFRAARQTP
jgi:hypothetical protein